MGWSSGNWHPRVDNRGPTLTVIRTSKGYIFGGYTEQNWKHAGYRKDPNAWLFWLKCYAKLPPTRVPVKAGSPHAIFAHQSYGPTFGGGHDIYLTSNLRKGYSNWCHTYPRPAGYKSAIFLTGSNAAKTITEVEVYKVV